MLYDQQSRGKIMDAAQNLFKKTALFLVIALAVAIPGRAQAPAFTAPGAITLSGTGGQDVTIGSTGGSCAMPPCSIAFSTSKTYSGGDPNWLTVSGDTSKTPTTLTFFQSGAGLLSAGTHTATVTLHATDGSGAADVNIPVTYTTGFGRGGSGTLTASPNSVTL